MRESRVSSPFLGKKLMKLSEVIEDLILIFESKGDLFVTHLSIDVAENEAHEIIERGQGIIMQVPLIDHLAKRDPESPTQEVPPSTE